MSVFNSFSHSALRRFESATTLNALFCYILFDVYKSPEQNLKKSDFRDLLTISFYIDLLACRPCGLVFAHAWGLKDHQIRECPVDEPPAKRCKREDTYDYELECYLKDLPTTVCCAD